MPLVKVQLLDNLHALLALSITARLVLTIKQHVLPVPLVTSSLQILAHNALIPPTVLLALVLEPNVLLAPLVPICHPVHASLAPMENTHLMVIMSAQLAKILDARSAPRLELVNAPHVLPTIT